MKKLMTLFFLLALTLGAKAQFEEGKKYVGASLTGLGLSYSSSTSFSLGLSAEAGYFIKDNWQLRAALDYDHQKHVDNIGIDLGARYYFQQNGIFLGAGLAYDHFTKSINSVSIPLEVGYAFFLTRHVTVQPSVYYKMSLNKFSDCSRVGLRIGFGYYF